MDRPQNIFLPTLYNGHPATISWDAVVGVEGYVLERRINAEEFVEAGTSTTTNFTDVVPVNATTATYRVQSFGTPNLTWDELESKNRDWNEWDALDWTWFSEHSEFTESETKSVIQIIIQVPTLHAGYIAPISWTGITEASGYFLYRKLDSETTFKQIYSGTQPNFTDTIPESAKTATYRLSWYIGRDLTWNDLESRERDWDAWDALNWTWDLYNSLFTETEAFEVIPNRPPVISGQNANLGTKYKGFTVTFSATDPDPINTVTLQVKLNSTVIFTMPNAQQGADYTATITDAQIFAMTHGSVHTITITATDNKGATATRTYTFTAVEDLVSTAVFYLLRDGQPIAKLGSAHQWTDYMEVGTHRYIVRGVDRYGNFSDSNEVTVTTTLKHAVLALVSNPANFIGLIWRLDGKPSMGRNYTTNFTETWYEGREFPVYENSGQKSNSVPLAFSTLNLHDQQSIFRIISQGAAVIYRDQYESRVVGVVPNFGNEFQGRYRNQTHNALINFDITINQSDFNEVIEYD